MAICSSMLWRSGAPATFGVGNCGISVAKCFRIRSCEISAGKFFTIRSCEIKGLKVS